MLAYRKNFIKLELASCYKRAFTSWRVFFNDRQVVIKELHIGSELAFDIARWVAEKNTIIAQRFCLRPLEGDTKSSVYSRCQNNIPIVHTGNMAYIDIEKQFSRRAAEAQRTALMKKHLQAN